MYDVGSVASYVNGSVSNGDESRLVSALDIAKAFSHVSSVYIPDPNAPKFYVDGHAVEIDIDVEEDLVFDILSITVAVDGEKKCIDIGTVDDIDNVISYIVGMIQ